MNDGPLQHRYDVVKRSTGEAVTDCFVLVPGKDVHAREALKQYARSVRYENAELANDLYRWLAEINPQPIPPKDLR